MRPNNDEIVASILCTCIFQFEVAIILLNAGANSLNVLQACSTLDTSLDTLQPVQPNDAFKSYFSFQIFFVQNIYNETHLQFYISRHFIFNISAFFAAVKYEFE